jgi:hypothetical protein
MYLGIHKDLNSARVQATVIYVVITYYIYICGAGKPNQE